jgi:hypothetical protein
MGESQSTFPNTDFIFKLLKRYQISSKFSHDAWGNFESTKTEDIREE